VLETFPFFKIWHAGCSTGEEPYSLAILLKEHGLLDRARIYATDLSPNVIKKAKDGIFTEKKLVEYQSGYQQAGGQGALRDHFFVRYGSAKIDGHIRQRITFACHNLVTDSVFAEVQMIVCRNVMIYFDAGLKKHVLSLFSNALSPGGLLCLGSQESLEGVNDNGFEKLSSANRIYKKAHPTSKVVRMCH
jgi:chemotaxis protein methyltransferase CheR